MRGGGNDVCTRSIVRTVSTGCEPPSVLRPGCYICKKVVSVDYWHRACSSSLGGGGGGRHPGTGLTMVNYFKFKKKSRQHSYSSS